MPSFEKGGGSRNSHEMRLSGMDLFISFRCGECTLDFMILTCSMSFKVIVPKERMRPALINAHNEMNDTKGFRIG